MDYLYDGSFEGLLTCIYQHYYMEKATGLYDKSQYQADIFNAYKEIPTELEKSDIVYRAIIKKISQLALRNTYYLYLSNSDEKENLILKYLIRGFKIGSTIDALHSDHLIHQVHLIARKVSLENHRFLGILRFSEIQGTLYSEIEPDHDILVLLGDHFSDRFKSHSFIIHDKKRKKALISKDGEWLITEFDTLDSIQQSHKECAYRDLWKNYYNHIAVEGRENNRLRKQYMPARYWKHLPEMI